MAGSCPPIDSTKIFTIATIFESSQPEGVPLLWNVVNEDNVVAKPTFAPPTTLDNSTWFFVGDPAIASGSETRNLTYAIQSYKGAKNLSDGIEGDINASEKFRWAIEKFDQNLPDLDQYGITACDYYKISDHTTNEFLGLSLNLILNGSSESPLELSKEEPSYPFILLGAAVSDTTVLL